MASPLSSLPPQQSGAGSSIGGAGTTTVRTRSRSSSGSAGDVVGSLPLSSPRRQPQPVPEGEVTEFSLATSTDVLCPPLLSLDGPAVAVSASSDSPAVGHGSGDNKAAGGTALGGANSSTGGTALAAVAESASIAEKGNERNESSQLLAASVQDNRKQKLAPAAPTTSDFQLLCVIGMGAFGRVLQVRNRVDSKVYAMKVISKKVLRRKNSVENMRAEQDILTKIKHPFIMQLQCSFSSAEKLFLVMDYMHGGELFFHLRKSGLLLDDTARFYVGEILLAIEHLHHKGIIHRDLKPENVLVSLDGHAVLTDFGLAKDFSNVEVENAKAKRRAAAAVKAAAALASKAGTAPATIGTTAVAAGPRDIKSSNSKDSSSSGGEREVSDNGSGAVLLAIVSAAQQEPRSGQGAPVTTTSPAPPATIPSEQPQAQPATAAAPTAPTEMPADASERTRTLCGTTEYMAPEMLRRTGYGKAVDFWALGALLYEMMVGKPPFQGKTTKDTEEKILKDKPKFAAYLMSDAVAVMKGLLEKNVLKRLGTVKSTMFEVGGVAALKAMPFFNSLSWSKLLNKQIAPPLTINCGHDEDTQNFDAEFTGMGIPLSLSEPSSPSNSCPGSPDWRGFDWAAPGFGVPSGLDDGFSLDECGGEGDDDKEPASRTSNRTTERNPPLFASPTPAALAAAAMLSPTPPLAPAGSSSPQDQDRGDISSLNEDGLPLNAKQRRAKRRAEDAAAAAEALATEAAALATAGPASSSGADAGVASATSSSSTSAGTPSSPLPRAPKPRQGRSLASLLGPDDVDAPKPKGFVNRGAPQEPPLATNFAGIRAAPPNQKQQQQQQQQKQKQQPQGKGKGNKGQTPKKPPLPPQSHQQPQQQQQLQLQQGKGKGKGKSPHSPSPPPPQQSRGAAQGKGSSAAESATAAGASSLSSRPRSDSDGSSGSRGSRNSRKSRGRGGGKGDASGGNNGSNNGNSKQCSDQQSSSAHGEAATAPPTTPAPTTTPPLTSAQSPASSPSVDAPSWPAPRSPGGLRPGGLRPGGLRPGGGGNGVTSPPAPAAVAPTATATVPSSSPSPSAPPRAPPKPLPPGPTPASTSVRDFPALGGASAKQHGAGRSAVAPPPSTGSWGQRKTGAPFGSSGSSNHGGSSSSSASTTNLHASARAAGPSPSPVPPPAPLAAAVAWPELGSSTKRPGGGGPSSPLSSKATEWKPKGAS